ncbi:hypothetical protein IMZ48_36085, partial [Candidatus Bathyarchaeota archaeon]|nr:hypothetical protein [Candidatus Bathyarchaeota archaeon]
MSDSDRPRAPERPRGPPRSQQSAIRLIRPSNNGRTGSTRSTRPSSSASNNNVALPRLPRPTRSRAATTTVHDTLSTGGEAGAGSRQIRQASVLSPVPASESEGSPAGSETPPRTDGPETGSERTGRRGLLARMRWRSDTNLHAPRRGADSIS